MANNPSKRHHYVPAAILGEWAAPGGPVGPRRERRVKVHLKGKGIIQLRATEACFRNQLYKLPQYEDARERGLSFLTIAGGAGLRHPPARDQEYVDDFLRRVGDDTALRARLTADYAESRLGVELDTPFVNLTDRMRVREAHDPKRTELKLIRRFMLLSLVRNPVYLEGGLEADRARSMAAGWKLTGASGDFDHDVVNHPAVELQHRILAEVFYPLAIVCMLKRTALQVAHIPTQLTLLETTAELPFVIGDHPCFPHLWVDGLPKLDAPWPGFTTNHAIMAMPLSPRQCIMLTRRLHNVPFGRARATPQLVRSINTVTATTAVRHVVLPHDADDLFLPGFELATSPPWTRTFLGGDPS